MGNMIIELTDTDLKTKLEGADGILFFYKKLCPHCKALRTVIEKFVAVKGDVTIMQIDSEENPEAMAAMSVERVPALLVVKGGKVVTRKIGLMNVRELTSLYNSA